MRRSALSLALPKPRLVVSAIAIGVAAVAFAPGCGSRGPLDINVVDPDASAGQPTLDASLDAANDVHDSAPPPHDAKSDAPFALDSGIPILDCGACVFGNCQSQLIACISNTACQQTLGCVVQTCLAGGAGGGGGFNPQCLQTCGTDPASTAAALRVLTCILNNCGNTCLGALGGLGGGGGGGSGGGTRDGG